MEDKRTSAPARKVWKHIRNNFSLDEWFNSELIFETFIIHFNRRQIISALSQLEKRGFIHKEQQGVRVINENFLIQLIKRVPQKDYVRLANVIENYFIGTSTSDDRLPNGLATLFLIEEQYKNITPEEYAQHQMMLIIDNYFMETYQ
ncbi:hypothetical protein [Neobacillus sp. NPDC093127]|uniref:hypothetical protein n=1 Tax=Neobacillus sp. NPDC093127 TaxID=3364296 RepID=UPI00382DFE01